MKFNAIENVEWFFFKEYCVEGVGSVVFRIEI